jgi:predicted glycoside hydrolase/deacetylase ChbG (UPF0249 family)
MKRLVVNADDYGMAVGVNAGIIEGHQRGIITSTTIMATGGALSDGVARLKEAPALATGCHLVLLGERPISAPARVSSLIDRDGNFPRTLTAFMLRMMAGEVKYQEILTEFRAQLDRLIELGITLSHCDSHKHSHAHPMVLDAAIQVAEEYKIRYIRNPFERCRLRGVWQLHRANGSGQAGQKFVLGKMLGYYRMVFDMRMRETPVRCPDHFHGFVATGLLSPEIIRLILAQVPEGISELMCHPARLEADLQASATRLKESRERELAALTSTQAHQAIKEHSIELTSFRELAREF